MVERVSSSHSGNIAFNVATADSNEILMAAIYYGEFWICCTNTDDSLHCNALEVALRVKVPTLPTVLCLLLKSKQFSEISVTIAFPEINAIHPHFLLFQFCGAIPAARRDGARSLVAKHIVSVVTTVTYINMGPPPPAGEEKIGESRLYCSTNSRARFLRSYLVNCEQWF
jgi:hypothetical protein